MKSMKQHISYEKFWYENSSSIWYKVSNETQEQIYGSLFDSRHNQIVWSLKKKLFEENLKNWHENKFHRRVMRYIPMKLAKYSKISNINTYMRNKKLHMKLIIVLASIVLVSNVLLYLLLFDNSLFSKLLNSIGPLLQGSGF